METTSVKGAKVSTKLKKIIRKTTRRKARDKPTARIISETSLMTMSTFQTRTDSEEEAREVVEPELQWTDAMMALQEVWIEIINHLKARTEAAEEETSEGIHVTTST